jgi:hypothetical protein
MKRAFGFALALSLLALPGLGRAETMENLGEQLVKAVEDMASIIAKDKDNCDVMASDLSDFADKNAPLFAKAKEAEKTATPDQKKAWKEKYQGRMTAAMEKAKPGMMACSKSEKVKTAIGKMGMK